MQEKYDICPAEELNFWNDYQEEIDEEPEVE